MFYSNTIDYTPWSEYAEYFGFELFHSADDTQGHWRRL